MNASEARGYPQPGLWLDGVPVEGEHASATEILDPATGACLATLQHATPAQVEAAAGGALRAFTAWRGTPALARGAILRAAAGRLRERRDAIARGITLDQGKPLAEALQEVDASADHLDWHAEEARRIYGRTIPPRQPHVLQLVEREPVGVVAAFTPWNFPLSQAVRKVAAALGAGCTVVLKGPENAPSAVGALARALHDAGLPPGCLQLVWGDPPVVAQALIDAPAVRCVSFTGSVPVGRQLAEHAGRRLKRTSFELGGHAPVLVFDDADIPRAAATLATMKWRNAGQVCVSPCRVYVQRRVLQPFLDAFITHAAALVVGAGLDARTTMGPLARPRRRAALAAMLDDARHCGADIAWTGHAPEGGGFYFAPTIVVDAPARSQLMCEEPFGPVAVVNAWDDADDVMAQANALPYGLAAYVFTRSAERARSAVRGLDAGQIGVNHWGLALPETPIGGVNDSGWGHEGGQESFEPYLRTKFSSQAFIA